MHACVCVCAVKLTRSHMLPLRRWLRPKPHHHPQWEHQCHSSATARTCVQQSLHPFGRLRLHLDLHHGIGEVDSIAGVHWRAHVPAGQAGQGRAGRAGRAEQARQDRRAAGVSDGEGAVLGSYHSARQQTVHAPAGTRQPSCPAVAASCPSGQQQQQQCSCVGLACLHQSPGARGAPTSRTMCSWVSRLMRT